MSSQAIEGFDDMFRDEHATILRASYLVTGGVEMAKEVTQDAFAQLYAHWPKVSQYERPGAWVRHVAIRRAVKVARRERRRATLERPVRPAQAAEPVGAATMEALAELSPMQRAIVVLHYFDGLPVREAAAVAGCKPATASVHLNRARTRLGVLLGPGGTGEHGGQNESISQKPEQPEKKAIPDAR